MSAARPLNMGDSNNQEQMERRVESSVELVRAENEALKSKIEELVDLLEIKDGELEDLRITSRVR